MKIYAPCKERPWVRDRAERKGRIFLQTKGKYPTVLHPTGTTTTRTTVRHPGTKKTQKKPKKNAKSG
jgi:hypothetical protein